ncbi:MAG: hypothetical protein PF961_16580 [Planctomycetota bacterium]|jgi:hypothetical protein|nr:hypothetical protein [Planctomycetota bacterium]
MSCANEQELFAEAVAAYGIDEDEARRRFEALIAAVTRPRLSGITRTREYAVNWILTLGPELLDQPLSKEPYPFAMTEEQGEAAWQEFQALGPRPPVPDYMKTTFFDDEDIARLAALRAELEAEQNRD